LTDVVGKIYPKGREEVEDVASEGEAMVADLGRSREDSTPWG